MTVKDSQFLERWCLHKARQWLSAAMGVPRETFLKRKLRRAWAGTLSAAALPADGKDWGCGLLPLDAAGQIDHKVPKQEHYSALAWLTWQGRGCAGWMDSAARAVSWELDGWELSTWDYLKPDRAPFSGGVRTSRKGRSHPARTSCWMENTFSGEDLQNGQVSLKNTLHDAFPKEEDSKRNA